MGQGSSASGVETAGGGPASDIGGFGGGGGGASGGIMGILGPLGGLLGGGGKDPSVTKEILGLSSKLNDAIAAGTKLSPKSREMLTQAIQRGQQGAQRQRPMGPFVGDMTNYITPEMARSVLNELNIPSRR